jgi:hypothetical protein
MLTTKGAIKSLDRYHCPKNKIIAFNHYCFFQQIMLFFILSVLIGNSHSLIMNDKITTPDDPLIMIVVTGS